MYLYYVSFKYICKSLGDPLLHRLLNYLLPLSLGFWSTFSTSCWRTDSIIPTIGIPPMQTYRYPGLVHRAFDHTNFLRDDIITEYRYQIHTYDQYIACCCEHNPG